MTARSSLRGDSALRSDGPLVQPSGLVEFLEALYRWDISEEEWMRGLCAPLLAVAPAGMWVQANTYDVSDNTFKCPTLVTYRAPPSLAQHFIKASANFTPEVIARCYYGSAVSMSKVPDVVTRETGARGVLSLKGLDPSGRSIGINLGIRDTRPINGRALALLRRIAGHLASGSRIQRRIAALAAPPTSGADAVFSTTGGVRLLHAEAPAKSRGQRQQLTEAVRRREAARNGDAQALEAWTPLVDTRWTLVDEYEVNGKRYIVARENHVDAKTLEVLSDRERQVVACLAFGQTTKEIAYLLGVDASTVRVLLQRAARKLDVRGRAGLLDHPAVRAMRGGIGATELAQLRASERTPQ